MFAERDLSKTSFFRPPILILSIWVQWDDDDDLIYPKSLSYTYSIPSKKDSKWKEWNPKNYHIMGTVAKSCNIRNKNNNYKNICDHQAITDIASSLVSTKELETMKSTTILFREGWWVKKLLPVVLNFLGYGKSKKICSRLRMEDAWITRMIFLWGMILGDRVILLLTFDTTCILIDYISNIRDQMSSIRKYCADCMWH